MKLQIADTNDEYNQLELGIADMHVDALDLNSVDISTREGASAAMSKNQNRHQHRIHQPRQTGRYPEPSGAYHQQPGCYH